MLDQFTCFQGVTISSCTSQRIGIDNASSSVYVNQAKKWSGEYTTFLALGLKFVLLFGASQMTTNQLKGLNAVKCSAVALLDESW